MQGRPVIAFAILIIFYSLGYACGNVSGILVERRLAFGMTILKVFISVNGHALADKLRSMGQPVTIFQGEGTHYGFKHQ
ncbi:hypothetical protein JCM39068_40970 [Desulfocastanea catecholica]